jgi:hypothetical protein
VSRTAARSLTTTVFTTATAAFTVRLRALVVAVGGPFQRWAVTGWVGRWRAGPPKQRWRSRQED